jgi:2-C-methyl-D-erythritol 4-phosphate cytidylyltransferase
VAAGAGTRFGAPKQYEELQGRRVLDWSLSIARDVTDHVVLVVPPDRVADEERAADIVVAGGATRSASVRAGLAALPAETAYVLVHDAARPFPAHDVWRRVVEALTGGADAAVPVVPVADSLRRRSGGVVDRDDLVAVQTPQGFRAGVLRAAHAGNAESTDDASLAEAVGATVVLVEGDRRNIKITSPFDLAVLEALLP